MDGKGRSEKLICDLCRKSPEFYAERFGIIFWLYKPLKVRRG
jgi:hypothetical protein